MDTYVCHGHDHVLVTDDKYKGSAIVSKLGVVKYAENMKFSTRRFYFSSSCCSIFVKYILLPLSESNSF